MFAVINPKKQVLYRRPNKKMNEPIEEYFKLGWFHLILFIISSICMLGCEGNMAFQAFGAIKPTIYCNFTPYDDSEGLCLMISNGSCTNFSMVSSFASIVTEWHLICELRSIAYLCTSLQMVGVLVGAPFFGQLSDTFGRKWVLVSDCVLLILSGSLSSLSPNWQTFMAFRFLIGFFTGGFLTVMFVFNAELAPTKHRTWLSNVFSAPIGYFLLGPVAYLATDWRTLARAVNFSLIPGLLAIIFILPESARWLAQKGRLSGAEKSIQRVNRINKRTISLSDLRALLAGATTDGTTKKHSFWHLFYTWELLRYTLVLALAWFTISCVTYGILFGAGQLSGSTFFNVSYYGLIKGFMGCVVALSDVFLPKCGRKVIHSIAIFSMFSCTATILLTDLLVPDSESVWQKSVTKYLSLTAAGMTTPVWLMVYLLTAELYPTPIRNLANSFSSVCARVGGVLAPQILFLGEYWDAAPYLTYSSILLLDFAAFLLFLPETKGKPLPQQMPPADQRICAGNLKIDQEEEEEALEENNPLINACS